MEDKMVEFTTVEQNKEKRMKRNEDSLRDLWDNKQTVVKNTISEIKNSLEEIGRAHV